MKATVEIVKIGPKQAEQLLSSQVKEQRHLRNSYVQTLATDMKDGNFRLSADALVVIKGQLANGQHRMWAIIESNTTQQFLMMDTDDEQLYKVLDCGLRRTVGDAAHVNNSTSVVAIAALVLGYKDQRLTHFGYTKKAARVEMIEFIQKNDEDLQFANALVCSLTQKHTNIAPKSVASALVVLCRPLYGDKVLEFLNSVYSGNNPDSATHDLRERCIKMRMQRGIVASQYYFALMIKSFNSYIKGTRLGTLKLNDGENYPQIMKPSK